MLTDEFLELMLGSRLLIYIFSVENAIWKQ